ncbi:MAG: hypothetical protein K6A80_05035 [Saccharofermentans sp.]|nr:hypothetical protein [Saccharofermentans sp.]
MLCSVLSKHKKIMAGIMGILMLFIVLFSAFYIIAEADHDCDGEDCPVCTCIQQCVNTLHQTDDGMPRQAAVIVSVVLLSVSVVIPVLVIPLETPVSSKVRLND